MCTSPITLTKTFPSGAVKQYTVPCGKCSECREAYQSEFAFMSFLEAEKRGSLHFFTLTYNNTWLPVAWCDWRSLCDEHLKAARAAGDDNPSYPKGRIEALQRGSDCYSWQLDDWSEHGCSAELSDDGSMVCPSLRREDIKLWLKKCRSYCDRHGLPKDFSFTCFGEYGEIRKRPHYHLLFAGLAPDQARIFSNLWTFGYSLVKPIPRFNKDGTDAFTLCAEYVSKYISKRDRLPGFVKDGFAEIPRRQSSVGFGKDLDFTKLRPFI